MAPEGLPEGAPLPLPPLVPLLPATLPPRPRSGLTRRRLTCRRLAALRRGPPRRPLPFRPQICHRSRGGHPSPPEPVAPQVAAAPETFIVFFAWDSDAVDRIGDRVIDEAVSAASSPGIPETTGQKVDQAEAAFRLAQQHQAAVRGDQATVEHRCHFFATDGWKIEGKKAIVGYGGCGKSVARAERRSGNDFLHDFNELRHTRQPFSRPTMNNAG